MNRRGKSTFTDIVSEAFSAKRYEPKPRRAAGFSEHYVGHRFPIKGGISFIEVQKRQFAEPNRLFTALMVRQK